MVELEALECGDMVDETLRYITPSMLGARHARMDNSQLYALEDEELGNCPKVTNCQFRRGRLSVECSRMYT